MYQVLRGFAVIDQLLKFGVTEWRVLSKWYQRAVLPRTMWSIFHVPKITKSNAILQLGHSHDGAEMSFDYD